MGDGLHCRGCDAPRLEKRITALEDGLRAILKEAISPMWLGDDITGMFEMGEIIEIARGLLPDNQESAD